MRNSFNFQLNMRIGKWEMIQLNISIGIGRHQDMVQIAGAIFWFFCFIFVVLNKLVGLSNLFLLEFWNLEAIHFIIMLCCIHLVY